MKRTGNTFLGPARVVPGLAQWQQRFPDPGLSLLKLRWVQIERPAELFVPKGGVCGTAH